MFKDEVRLSRQHFSELPSATYSIWTGRVDRLAGHDRHTLPGRFVVASEHPTSYLLSVLLALHVVLLVEVRASQRGVSESRSGTFYV